MTQLCVIRVNNCTYLMKHRLRVNLTHIGTRIISLHARDIEFPRVVSVMRDIQTPLISRHDGVVNCQDLLGIRFYPGHLKKKKNHLFIYYFTIRFAINNTIMCQFQRSCIGDMTNTKGKQNKTHFLFTYYSKDPNRDKDFTMAKT